MTVYVRCAVIEGRPAILYKSLPSLVLPASDVISEEFRRQHVTETITVGPGAVIPLKETLVRRLSASMDCIDVADNKEKLAATAPADDTITTTPQSPLGADVSEPETNL